MEDLEGAACFLLDVGALGQLGARGVQLESLVCGSFLIALVF